MTNIRTSISYNEAIDAADDAIYHLRSARRCLDSAGTWGILDIFGGNMITGLLKHSKMASAEREIDDAIRQVETISKRSLRCRLL